MDNSIPAVAGRQCDCLRGHKVMTGNLAIFSTFPVPVQGTPFLHIKECTSYAQFIN